MRPSPRCARLNMGSMNFNISGSAARIKSFKHDWERPYLEGTTDFIFRNTFKDIEQHRRTARQGPRHALRVRVLRRRPPLQPGPHARPQGGGAAALRADDLRHPRRHRRRAAQPAVHEGDGGPAVRRRLCLVRARRGAAPDALHHHGRHPRRQRPRRAGGQPVARQGRAGEVQRRAGGEDPPHPGGAEPGDRLAGGGAGRCSR